MLTSNYWNYRAFIESQYIGSGSNWDKVEIGLKGLTGDTVLFQKTRTDSAMYNYANVLGYCGVRSGLNIVVGTGSTDPLVSDYALESDVTTSFISRVTSCSTGAVDAGIKTVLILSGVNNTDSTITITEYGITKAIVTANSSTTPVLFLRDILSEPIVVPPGGGFTLPIEWVES